MRWVTYLSPSGGGARVGALDDGDVMGSPGGRSLGELLEGGDDALAAAHQRAVDGAIEIIVEPEARMCAPVLPTGPVPVLVGEREYAIGPELVRGVDDPVAPEARSARVGVAALAGGSGHASAYTPACLWLDEAGEPVELILGPVLTTSDELSGDVLELSTSVDDEENGHGRVEPDHDWLVSGPGRVRALLPVATPVLEADDELFVDAGELGTYEVRVGSQV